MRSSEPARHGARDRELYTDAAWVCSRRAPASANRWATSCRRCAGPQRTKSARSCRRTRSTCRSSRPEGSSVPCTRASAAARAVRTAQGCATSLSWHVSSGARASGNAAVRRRAFRQELDSIEAWSSKRRDGSLSDLDHAARSELWGRSRGRAGSVSACAVFGFFADCFLFKARREAAQADVIVVNHHCCSPISRCVA